MPVYVPVYVPVGSRKTAYGGSGFAQNEEKKTPAKTRPAPVPPRFSYSES